MANLSRVLVATGIGLTALMASTARSAAADLLPPEIRPAYEYDLSTSECRRKCVVDMDVGDLHTFRVGLSYNFAGMSW